MRFRSLNKPPIAPSWRIILWMITLVPMMLMASWFARRGPLSQPAHGVSGLPVSGLTKEDARRLDRILHSADGAPNSPSDRKSDGDLSSRHSTTDLASVSDNTFGIPNVERAAYEALLNQVSKADQSEFKRTTHRDVPFAVLMLEPDRFRGELITIEGDLRRLHRIPNAGNDLNKPESYEAWIFTTDSGLNPYRVVCTSLPTGLALGDQLTSPIRVRTTGYFFKRYSYATTGNYHTAPLLLAKTLDRVSPSKPSAQLPNHRARTLAIIAVCILLVLAIGWMLVGLSARQPKRDLEEAAFAELTDFK